MEQGIRIRGIILILILLFNVSVIHAQPCLPDGITFTTQSQIDSFPINYPGCTEIEGNVTIGAFPGTSIANLNGLSNLTSIGGDVYIHYNDSLTSLTGLEGLTSIGGGFVIFFNYALTSLTGLENVTSIGGHLAILHHQSLTNLGGLSGLTSIGSGLEIHDNGKLENLIGLNNLTSIGNDDVRIAYNYGLTSLSGLEGITSIENELWITQNNLLKDFTGLSGLVYIGSLHVVENQGLQNLSGMDNLTSIGGPFAIDNNDVLTSLSGLEGLTSIGGELGVWNNDALTNMLGLEGLTSIGGNLYIEGSDSLFNLMGLEGLTSIGGELGIWSNGLASLMGIDNIDEASIDYISINWNQSLSECEIESVCAFIAANGYVDIHDNSIGCNSPDEVQDSCEANAVNIDEHYIMDNLLLYPNPANQELNISVEGFTIDELVIYTLTGQQVYAIIPKSESIDISTLQPGMYIIQVTIENTHIRQKVMVH